MPGMIPTRHDEAPFPFDGLSRWNFNTLCRVLYLAQFQMNRDHSNIKRNPQCAYLSRSLKSGIETLSMHFHYGILPMESAPHSPVMNKPATWAWLKQPLHGGPFGPSAGSLLTALVFKHAIQQCFYIWPCPQSECFHCGPPERSTAPPVYQRAHNWRWQVKWLTCPLGLLTQGCRTPRHGRWYRALHVAVEVRWGKSLRNGKSSHIISAELFFNFCCVTLGLLMKNNDRKCTRTRLWRCLNSVLSICERTATCSKGAADVKLRRIYSPPHRSGSQMSERRWHEREFHF